MPSGATRVLSQQGKPGEDPTGAPSPPKGFTPIYIKIYKDRLIYRYIKIDR